MPSPDGLVSKGQKWAMFCRTGLKTTELDPSMTYYEAKDLLDKLNQDELSYIDAADVLKENGAFGNLKPFKKYVKGQKKTRKAKKVTVTKGTETAKDKLNRELYEKAVKAAEESVKAMQAPVPMVVQEHANMLDDNSPVVKQYAPAMGGVCGFSWVVVRPGNCSFANWLKKTSKARYDEYYRGVIVHGEDNKYNGQSMDTKAAWTSGFNRVISDAGIKTQVYTWMD